MAALSWAHFDRAARRTAHDDGSHSKRLLSALSEGYAEHRLALTVISVSVLVFAMAAPFARAWLAKVYASIPPELLLAASFVLVVLLLETSVLYERAARSFKFRLQERERRLRELQSDLIHLGRVSEMGQMALALAHEVNQPLSAINGFVRAGQRFIETGELEKGRVALRNAAEQSTRAAEIVRYLRGFLMNEKGEAQPESLETVIEEAQTLALLAAGYRGVRIKLDFDPLASEVVIHKVQIEQVLLNLIRNATDAMALGSRREIVIATVALEERMAEIQVADTGPGLSEDVRAKLFQPFVTAKAHGMGVGLSICRAIVEGHGGRIWATGNAGGGAVFHFTVPRR